MFSNSGCGCNSCNSCNNWGWNNSMNGCRATPIVAPRKVCTTCSNQYVEQPIICPIECRHVNNIVYYPRYYSGYNNTTGDSVINGMYNTTNNTGSGCGCNR